MRVLPWKSAPLVMVLVMAAPATHAGLITHYTMAEVPDAVLSDVSGHGHHGTISGASWSTGARGPALTFDGVDDYVTVLSSSWLNPTEALTVMAWVKWDIDPQTGRPWASIVSKNADNQYRLQHNQTNTAFEFAVRTTAGNRWVAGTTVPALDRWYHVAGTYDGGFLRLYVDGVLENSAAHSGSLLSSGSPLNIGRRAGANDRHFAGGIADVRLYDQALTGAEIAHAIPEPATLGLVGLGAWVLLARRRGRRTAP